MSQRSREKLKGRTGPQFIQLYGHMLNSPQWAELPAMSVKLLMELARQYRGFNNGDLAVTLSMLKERGWTSEPTIWKHLRILEERGWIVKTRQGGRHIGCNLYAITWEPIDDCEGKHQHPPENKASHRWKNAIGTAKNEVRKSQKVKCEGVGLQKVKGKVVPIRPAA